jgi:hypothetical protein
MTTLYIPKKKIRFVNNEDISPTAFLATSFKPVSVC